MAKAILNSLGQLVSEVNDPTKAPLEVASSKMVANLNAQKLNDIEESSMLRTDANRTLTAEMEVEGTINVSTGKLKIGDFELKQTDGVFHIDVVD